MLAPDGRETSRRYLFVAIDRATRWAYRAISPNKTAATKAVLNARHQVCPIRITLVRTDNKQGSHRSPVRLCGPTADRHARVSSKTGRLTGVWHASRSGFVYKINRTLAVDDIKRQVGRWLRMASATTRHLKPILAEIALNLQDLVPDRSRRRKPQSKPQLSHACEDWVAYRSRLVFRLHPPRRSHATDLFPCSRRFSSETQ